jgi:hypothetical protein
MATVAPWAEAQLHSPSWRPLASPRQWDAASVRAPRAQRVVTTPGAASARGMVSSPVLHRIPNDDKINGMSTTMAQATRHYTDPSMETAGKGSSPEQRRHSALKWTNGSKLR